MSNLDAIHAEIEELSEQRTELYQRLSEGLDTSVRDEIHKLDDQLENLWNEHRRLRAELRWGDREHIIQRARAEERLERHAA